MGSYLVTVEGGPEKPPTLQFRPHHFQCTLGFEGKGYSPHFVSNYQKVVDRITEDPHTPIEVVNKLDSICSPCPHQTNTGLCQKQEFISQLDKAHAQILDLEEHQIITWFEAKERIKKHMTLEKFHIACHGCPWKAYGMCEAALRSLLDAIEQ